MSHIKFFNKHFDMTILRCYFYIKLYSDALQIIISTCCFEIFIISDLISTNKFMKIYIKTHNNLCYKIFDDTNFAQINQNALKTVVETSRLSFFIIFCHKTTNKFVKISMNTPHYVYCKIF
jgi:hypothetical protein